MKVTISVKAPYGLQDILAFTLRVVSCGIKSNPPIFQIGRNLYEGMGRYYRLIDPSRHLWPNHPIDAAATADQHESQAEPCRDHARERTRGVTVVDNAGTALLQ